MNIASENLKIIVDEMKEVDKECDEAQAIEDKLYFFSASFGIINRIMNLECDPLLVFIHQILQSTHQALYQRLNLPKAPGVIMNNVPEIFIKSFFKYYKELVIALEKQNDQEIKNILEKFSNLSYATTGNGYYLFLREKLKLS
jgi:hypothetical protein